MTIWLYVETNFLMSVAFGRDSEAIALTQNPPQPITFVLPSLCFMESLSAFESEQKRRNAFRDSLELQIGQLRRDRTSPHARSLLQHLEAAKIENQNLLNDVRQRLAAIHDYLANQAELIQLTPEILLASAAIPHVEDPTDNLLLHCISAHACTYFNDRKAFLTGDDLLRAAARKELQKFGVEKYFSQSKDCLGWLQSQSNENDIT